MAIRPPARRRGSARRRQRRLPDEAIAVIAGALIATMLLRVIVRAAGIENWTTTWQVVNALTAPAVWPLEQLGLTGPPITGSLQLSDVIAAVVLVILGMYLLASRAIIPARG